MIKTMTDNGNTSFFSGITFTFTGKLSLMDRAEASGLVKMCGGDYSKNLTKRTKVLVVGSYHDHECFRNKYNTALKYNEQGLDINIIDENTFYQMLFRYFALAGNGCIRRDVPDQIKT